MGTPTGKTRYRTNWRGKIILQVEVASSYCTDLNGSGYYDTGEKSWWRDAKAIDFINPHIANHPLTST